MRCDKDGGSCANISGATDKNGYVLKNVDVGNTIRFKVQAKNADGNTTETSVPTAVITAAAKPAPPVSNGCAATGGDDPGRERLAARAPVDRPDRDQPEHDHLQHPLDHRALPRLRVRRLRRRRTRLRRRPCRTASSRSRTSRRPAPTAGRPLQFSALSGYPVSKNQQLLVMFVRARKAGDPLLGGISTRRLVSFHVTRG